MEDNSLLLLCRPQGFNSGWRAWQLAPLPAELFARLSRTTFKILGFWNRISLCSLGCPGTQSVNKTGLQLREIPVSASGELGLKTYATTVWPLSSFFAEGAKEIAQQLGCLLSYQGPELKCSLLYTHTHTHTHTHTIMILSVSFVFSLLHFECSVSHVDLFQFNPSWPFTVVTLWWQQ
jgi:hypothetical protein